MEYKGFKFNEEFWKMKTEQQFIDHEAVTGLSVEELKEAYKLMTEMPSSLELSKELLNFQK